MTDSSIEACLTVHFISFCCRHVLKIEELTSESVLYWKCLAEYIQSQGAEMEEHLDKIVPNGMVFSNFMKE